MTFVRSLLFCVGLAATFALGACEKQPVSTIESIEKTLHAHEGHGDHGGHGEEGAHGKESHGTKGTEGATESATPEHP